MKTITLTRSARLFERAFAPPSPLLRWEGRCLSAGRTIEIGESVTMTYDHRDMTAFPCSINNHHEGFVLESEIEPNKK